MPPEVPQATDNATAAPGKGSCPAVVGSAATHPNVRSPEEETRTSRSSGQRRSSGRPDVLPTSPTSPEVPQRDDSTTAAPAVVTIPGTVVPASADQNIRSVEGEAQTSHASPDSGGPPEFSPILSVSSEGHQEADSSTTSPCTATASAAPVPAPLHTTSNLEDTRTSQGSRYRPVDLPTSPGLEVAREAYSTSAAPAIATTPAVAEVAQDQPAILPALSESADGPQVAEATTTAPTAATSATEVAPPPQPAPAPNKPNVEEETRPSRISRQSRSRSRPASPDGPLGADATTTTAPTASVGAPCAPPFRPCMPNLGDKQMSRMSRASRVSRSRRSCGRPEPVPVLPTSPEGTQGADATTTIPATFTETAMTAPPPLVHPNIEGEARALLMTRSKHSSGPPAIMSPLSPLSPGNPQDVGASATWPVSTMTSAPPLDNILIFGHGRFQRLILLCTTLAFFVAMLHTASLASLARPVDHWCTPPAEYARLPVETWKNSSVPLEAGGKRYSQCHRYEPPVPVVKDIDMDNRSVVPCDNGWDYEVGFSTGLGAPSIVQQWDIVCNRHWILGALSALNMLGGAIGAPIAGVTADMIGRRPVLVIWVIFLMFSGIAVVFANTMLLFTVLHTLLSTAASSVFVTSVVVLFEVTDMQHRAAFCSLAIVGALFMATAYHMVISKFSLTWQASQIAYMIPSCGLVLAVYMMDESPCWLLAVSDVRRAECAIMCNAEAHASDLLRIQTLRHRSLIIFGCFFTCVAVYYSLKKGELMRTNETANQAHLLLLLPSILVNVPIVMRAGRRRSLALSMVCLSLLAAALGAAHIIHAPEQVQATITVSWLLVFSLSSIAMFVISAELYPTVLRGAGVSFCYACGRVGGLMAIIADVVLKDELRGATYIAAAALLLLFGTMATALPETTIDQPANTMRDMEADKWQLHSPIRVARKHRRPRLVFGHSRQD
ncbi:hypothetical protein V5799_024925 [Amblyomma americanum]|uniref:Major facilitator superfamily (MFS) profile domain-containing protein n=1 Tax=Amblyomma americanum TaxID=6943 RepID=A0AAQ4EAN2_AMBAM